MWDCVEFWFTISYSVEILFYFLIFGLRLAEDFLSFGDLLEWVGEMSFLLLVCIC